MSKKEFIKRHGKKSYQEIIMPLLESYNLEEGTDPALRLIANADNIISQTLKLLRLNHRDGIIKNRVATKNIQHNLRRLAKKKK